VRFGVLGPLRVVDGAGVSWSVPAAKQRILLAALLLARGSTVSSASLTEALWDEYPPPNAPAVIRTYVMRLRRALGPAGARVIGRSPAWAVELHGAEELDVTEVDELWRAARAAGEAGDFRRASSLLARALGLWRGEPLADVPSDALTRREAGKLAELRLQLTEARIDADLRLGLHGERVGELRQLVAEHPLREHFRAQLMLACYACGQQGAALEVYRDAHAILTEELGVEPGRELQELHHRILTADPDLTSAAAVSSPPQEPAEGRVAAGAMQVAADHVLPRQLPAAPAGFAGRQPELRSLTACLDAGAGGGPVIVTISGTPGVGKTALALHWAHEVAQRFPDGQLYVNLRGFDASLAPVTPDEAIAGFVESLGVAVSQVPAQLDTSAALYRSLLAGKRILVILDNARDEAQVRPLLPGSPTCVVLVTSRRELTGLVASEGARPLVLEILTAPEARQLLAGRLGAARVAAEAAEASELISLCAYLPLALAIAAARAATRQPLSLTSLVGELRDIGHRLDGLEAGDEATNIKAVFSWSYRLLAEPAARMFRLLGAHPGPDISADAAASLAAVRAVAARSALAELVRAGLVHEPVPGRFTVHDLLRAYADELASQAERHAGLQRVLDYYLHTAYAAIGIGYPAARLITIAGPGTGPARLPGPDQALAWLQEEHEVLLAAIAAAARAGFDTHAWQLSAVLREYFARRGHYRDWAQSQQEALPAAVRLGDDAPRAFAHWSLGDALIRLGSWLDARRHLQLALTLYRNLGDHVGQADCHCGMSRLSEAQGDHAAALVHARRALRMYRVAGDQTGEAAALNGIGWHHLLLGNRQQALSYCTRALSLNRAIGNRFGEAATLDSLGYSHHQAGRHSQAAAFYTEALCAYADAGDRYNRAQTLIRLGNTHRAAGDPRAARDVWQQAAEILDDLHHPDARSARARLEESAGSPA